MAKPLKKALAGQLALAFLCASALKAACLDLDSGANANLWQKFAPLLQEDLRPGVSTRAAFETLFHAPQSSRRSDGDKDVYKYEWKNITVYISDTRDADGKISSTTLHIERDYDRNTCITREEMLSGLSSAGWSPGRAKEPSANSHVMYSAGEVFTLQPDEQYFRKNVSFNAFFDAAGDKNGLVCAVALNLVIGEPE